MKKSLCLIFVFFVFSAVQSPAQYVVDVQVVDLQVSVADKQNNFITDLKPDDFLVFEDGVQQEVLDLQLQREPFSIGVLLDTSSSMRSSFLLAKRGTLDFVHSLRPEDEFFIMTFDDRIKIRREMGTAADWSTGQWKDTKYGQGTKLFETVFQGVKRLQTAKFPRRALFIISDGINTAGQYDLYKAIEEAQKNKVIIYSLLIQDASSDLSVLRQLSENTGGTYFLLYEQYPRLQVAYEKIATDLANRFTLYYRSRSDYSKARKPEIKVQMKDPSWRVRYQKAYFPHSD